MADEDIRIRAELEGALTRDLTVATDAVDELGDEAQQTAAQLAIMDAAAKGASRSVSDLGRDSRSSSRDVDELAASHRRATKASDTHVSALSRFDSILKRIKGNKFDFGAVLNAYKIPAIVTAVSLLATAISALGAAGYAGVAGLAPLGSLLVAYPGFALAAGQGLAAVKLGLSGIGDAVKELSNPKADPERIAAALKDLSPAARTLAHQLVALNKGPLKQLKQATSNAIAPGFSRALDNLTPIWPILTRNISKTGGAIGGLADMATKAMSKPFFRGQLDRVMRTNTVVVSNGGKAIYYLMRTLFNLLDAFRPVLRSMSEYALRGAKFLATTSRAGVETGRLGAFFKRAWKLGRDFGAVIRDLVVGLFNIGQESKQMGSFLGGGLKQGAAEFRAWTDSLEGRASIRQWFADAIPVVREVLRLIGTIATMFGNLSTNQSLVPVLAQIRTQLLPAMSELATNTTTAFGPALVSAATAFVDFNNALTFSPLAVVLQGMANAVIAVTQAISAAPFPLNTMLASVLALSLGLRATTFAGGMLFRGFKPLIDVTRGFSSGATEAATAAGGLRKAAGATRTAMSSFKAGFTDAAAAQSAFTGKAGSFGGVVRKMIGLIGTGLTAAWTVMGTAARAAWLAITGPIGLTVLAILAVVGLGVLLYKKWRPFREFINALWAGIQTGAKATWDAIKVGVKLLWTVVKAYFTLLWMYWSTVMKIVLGVAKVVWALISTTVMTFWTFVLKPILKNMMAGFALAWGVIKAGARLVWTVVSTYFRLWWTVVSWVFGRVRWAAGIAWAAIKVGVRAVVAVAKRVWSGLVNIFGGPFNAVRSVAGRIFGWLGRRAATAVSAIQTAFSGLGGFLSGIWDGMKSGFSTALSWMKDRINDIIGAVNKVIGAFNKLPGGDIDKIPMLYAGGPTQPGMKAMVGEIGPEAWVKASGAVEIIGKHGPEVRQFASSGYVVPNHVLQQASAETDAKLPTALLRTLARSTEPTTAPRAASSTVIRYEDHSVIKIEVPPGTGGSTRELVDAVAKAVDELQRNREERLIHHGWKDETP